MTERDLPSYVGSPRGGVVGRVSVSQRISVSMASAAEPPHMSAAGWMPTQVEGRSGKPKRAHASSAVR